MAAIPSPAASSLSGFRQSVYECVFKAANRDSKAFPRYLTLLFLNFGAQLLSPAGPRGRGRGRRGRQRESAPRASRAVRRAATDRCWQTMKERRRLATQKKRQITEISPLRLLPFTPNFIHKLRTPLRTMKSLSVCVCGGKGAAVAVFAATSPPITKGHAAPRGLPRRPPRSLPTRHTSRTPHTPSTPRPSPSPAPWMPRPACHTLSKICPRRGAGVAVRLASQIRPCRPGLARPSPLTLAAPGGLVARAHGQDSHRAGRRCIEPCRARSAGSPRPI